MKTLSVFSIVKNESEMIREMLESTQGVFEHVVVDTGSTDGTQDIARSFTEKVFEDYTWNDNFSEAKNHAMSKCSGDFVIGLDADCRFAPGAIQTLNKFIQTADKDVYKIPLIWNKQENGIHHWLPKLFRRTSGVQYVGTAHETITKKPDGEVNAPIIFLYSPNHFKDPERNIRCLLKGDLMNQRSQFYLGREYYERKNYHQALFWLQQYLSAPSWPPERAEAYLTCARCYWFLNQGDKAREACGQAVLINPDFKEALNFMSILHYEPNKTKWKTIADRSTNSDVLFIRTK